MKYNGTIGSSTCLYNIGIFMYDKFIIYKYERRPWKMRDYE